MKRILARFASKFAANVGLIRIISYYRIAFNLWNNRLFSIMVTRFQPSFGLPGFTRDNHHPSIQT